MGASSAAAALLLFAGRGRGRRLGRVAGDASSFPSWPPAAYLPPTPGRECRVLAEAKVAGGAPSACGTFGKGGDACADCFDLAAVIPPAFVRSSTRAACGLTAGGRCVTALSESFLGARASFGAAGLRLYLARSLDASGPCSAVGPFAPGLSSGDTAAAGWLVRPADEAAASDAELEPHLATRGDSSANLVAFRLAAPSEA
mmetsp:Transcript_10393/g.28682  ORF Transcript_10393/g.28682 Transcript_10393/m.28682 type:complete len:201 (-) Transcript_10393:248-850(-)|eukprot:scaffold52159_cov31-Tisochrysis_lutea.AAC.5